MLDLCSYSSVLEEACAVWGYSDGQVACFYYVHNRNRARLWALACSGTTGLLRAANERDGRNFKM